MKVKNKDKFSRELVLLLLIIVAVVASMLWLQNREMRNQLDEMRTMNTDLLEAYEETVNELENYKSTEIFEIKQELTDKQKEVYQKAIDLDNMEQRLKIWESDLEAKQAEKDKQLAKNQRQETLAMGTSYPTRSVPLKSGEVKEVYLEVTMYTNAEGAYSPDSPHYGTMANGEKTHLGAVAGPKEIPFGSKVIIEEAKPGFEYLLDSDLTVKDRGGAIKKKMVDGKEVYCIDVYQPDINIAKQWGREIVKGKIVVY